MHSMRLLANINNDTNMKLNGAALVLQRGGKDSFSKAGLLQRALMSYYSFGQTLIFLVQLEMKSNVHIIF